MLLFNRYEYNPQTDIAGRGEFSRVYKAVDTSSGNEVALKIYKINDLSDHYHPIANSALILGLDHPSLCKYFDIREIEKEDSFGEKEKLQVCVTRFMNAGRLDSWYKVHRNPVQLQQQVINLLKALACLHEQSLIHGYIKPSNVLVSEKDGTAVAGITDYAMGILTPGASGSTGSHPLLSAVSYLSPEQLNAAKYGKDGKISFNTDYWSLGLVVYEALAGEPLFRVEPTDFPETITNRITNFELPASVHSFPAPFPAFLSACLVKHAGNRIQTAAELSSLLSVDTSGNIKNGSRPLSTPDNADSDDNTRIIALPGESKKPVFYIPDEDDGVDDNTKIIAQPTTEINDTDTADDDATQIIARPVQFSNTDSKPVEEDATNTDDDTRIISRPDMDTTEEEMADEYPPQIIAEPAQFSNTESKETTTEDDTKIIARPSVNTNEEEPADEDATRIIAKPVQSGIDKKPVQEDTGVNDDTKIIARPIADIPVIETADEDATQVIAKPALANQVNDIEEDATKVIQRPGQEITPVAPVAENEDDTRIISKPSVVSTTAIDATSEDDATKIIAKPNVQTNAGDEQRLLQLASNDTSITNDKIIAENKPVAKENDTPVDKTIILSITNKDKKADSNKPPVTHPQQPEVIIRRREKPVILFNRYEYLPATDMIGKGGFSRVYKAYDKKLSRWVALKIYKTGEFSDRYSPIAEIKRVVNLDHPNICRYLDIEEMENENPFGENEKIQVCVMELLDSGNFADYYKAHREPEILKKLVQDILNGLSYLHKNGIIHRDIKPANILIKQTIEGPVAKITDFGISKNSDTDNNNSSSALVVSIPYMAPEQLNAKKYGVNEKVSFNLDLWSLGVTIYEVFTGKVLFKNSDQDNSEQIMANIMAPEMPEKLNDLPEPFKTVVSHCVIKNARERASRAEELMVLLNASPVPGTTAALVSQAANTINTAEKDSINLQLTETPAQQYLSATEQTAKADVKPEIKQKTPSRFSMDEPEEKQRIEPKQKEEDKNKNKPLIIFISLAVLAFIAFVIFLNSSKQPVPDNNVVTAPKTDTTKKSVQEPVKSDTAQTIPVTSVTKTDTVKKQPEVITVKTEKIPEKKPEKAAEETHKKTMPKTETSTVVGGTKYVLAITSPTRCIIKVNSVNYGDVVPGAVPTRIYLGVGKYILQFVSSTDGSLVYTANIEVKPENIGHASKFKVPVH